MVEFVQSVGISILSFLVVLTLVVTVHELGHFWAAKACGVAIDRFSIGFGRAILSWKDKSGVEWRLGWIPLGGYVMFAGDTNTSSVPDEEDLSSMRARVLRDEGVEAVSRYLHFKPVAQRAFVSVAGPLANFVFSTVLFAILLATLGQDVLPARIAAVNPNSPADRAGFRAGDLIVKADGRVVRGFEDVAEVAVLRVNLPTSFVVERQGRDVPITATSQLQLREDGFGGKRWQGTFGITPAQARSDYVHLRYGPIEAIQKGAQQTAHTVSTTLFYLGRMVTGQVAADQLSGPLGIAHLAGKVTKINTAGATSFGDGLVAGSIGLLKLAAVLSVGVGFVNMLPIPVLDGGHLLFYAYEAVARRPVAAKVQALGYRVGLALVLSLMLFATWNDLQQLHVFKILGGLFS